ncbi:MAG: cob(I)yrinic acid a,c-diamide adenosyltransferase [Firmicutes bacterium]|jgi:cob(I)alamin adenosyltransferase|nr:cob(I)yrinic acid a,c-diamide adenosyltransferase [Bacillota bacterium]
MSRGYIHVYTGNGKGKTTAALGLCLRASGHGRKIVVIQFIKGRRCGEHIALERLGIPILQCTQGDVRYNVQVQWERAKSMLRTGDCDLVVWDEIMAAINHGYVKLNEVLDTMDAKPEALELVLTGRNAPAEIIQRADLVTSMEPVKHYFDTGVPAREGVEF